MLRPKSLFKKLPPVLKGFTIIELMVVVSIITIVATAGYASYKTGQNKSRDAKRKQDLKAVSAALVSYYQDNKAYPPACNPSPCTTTAQYTSDGSAPWIPGLTSSYLQELPKDPHQAGIITEYANIFIDFLKVKPASAATSQKDPVPQNANNN